MNLQIEVSSIFEFCVYTCVHLFCVFFFLFLCFYYLFCVFISCFALLLLVLRFHLLFCVFICRFAFSFLVLRFYFLFCVFICLSLSRHFWRIGDFRYERKRFFFRKLLSCFNTRVGRKFGFRRIRNFCFSVSTAKYRVFSLNL